MATAVIYARFSCSKQREASISDQIRVCRDWCERNRCTVVATYADEAISGRTDNRPEFRRMIASAGESDIVLVYAFDRFSRDPYDAPRYKMELARKGVRVVSATEALPEGPEGVLMDKLYEGFAAMESERIARRTKRGMEGNALKLMHNGVRVFGYALNPDGTYAVDPDEAQVVREVFARRIAGECMNKIARDLAARGVTTTRGNPCNYTMVRGILRSEKYTGVYRWGDVREVGGMPALVSGEEFAMAQKVRSKKVRATEDWSEYPLVGVASCYECGRPLVGVSGRGAHNVKYTYYRCSKRCGCKAIRQGWLENAIVDELRKLLSSRETALEIAQRLVAHMKDDSAAAALSLARKQLAEVEGAYANLIRAVEQGMPYSSVAERMGELEAQMKACRDEVDALEVRANVDPEDLATFLQEGRELDDATLLNAFVHQVWLSSDEVIVALRYCKSGEPARIEFRRGFEESAIGSPVFKVFELGKVAFVGDYLLVAIPRAA